MLFFISSALLLAGLTLAFILWPLYQEKPQASQGLQLSANLHALDDALLSGVLHVSEHEKLSSAVKLEQPESFAQIKQNQAGFSTNPAQQFYAALISILLIIVVGAPALYLQIGTPQAIDRLSVQDLNVKNQTVKALPDQSAVVVNNQSAANNDVNAANPGTLPQAGMTREQIEAMVQKLALKLKDNPKNQQGWRMLARSYETLQRFDQAVDAYKNLLILSPDDPEVLTDYAVTLAMSMNQSLAGEPEKLIQHALKVDPENLQALALLGSVAFERKDYRQAILHWKKIVRLAPEDSALANSVSGGISQAEALLDKKQ